MRLSALFFSIPLLLTASVFAEQQSYNPARTAFGHPDIQGTWSSASLTPLERNEKTPNLVISVAGAKIMVETIRSSLPDNIDPQFEADNINYLNQVNGQLRTSVVVDPEDGLIPYSKTGLQWVAWSGYRDQHLFDHPEQLPNMARCMGGVGLPPIRLVPIEIPHLIVQTPNHVLIYTEDTGGARIISLTDEPQTDAPRSWHGQSVGRWQGNSLIVHTSNFRAGDPTRFNLGRALLIGENTTVTERFTPLSERKLLYQFTVKDPVYYSEPWSGEFTFSKNAVPVFEYACHEGNYSMANMLRGGQKQRVERGEPVEVVAMPVEDRGPDSR